MILHCALNHYFDDNVTQSLPAEGGVNPSKAKRLTEGVACIINFYFIISAQSIVTLTPPVASRDSPLAEGAFN